MKKIFIFIFASFFVYSLSLQAAQNPQYQVPNVKLKPEALKPIAPKVIPVTVRGKIKELLCEDNEILVKTKTGQNYRVFPTVAIAGENIRNQGDIRRLCRQHLRVNQSVTVRGERATINGRNAIARASVTP